MITTIRHRCDAGAAHPPAGPRSQRPGHGHRHGAAANQATQATLPVGIANAGNGQNRRNPPRRSTTSWYTNDRAEHKQITGRDTHRQTLANIEEALRRGISLRVGLIGGILPGQRSAEGAELLRARGVTSIGTDHLREFGRGTNPDPTQACGGCGHRKAAVLPDGTVTPCPLTRWLNAGNVTATPLADTLATVTQIAAALLAQTGCAPQECAPDWKCRPSLCSPDTRIVKSPRLGDPCSPDCMPDHYCNPLCGPGVCEPRIKLA